MSNRTPAASDRGEVERPDLEGMLKQNAPYVGDFLADNANATARYALYLESKNTELKNSLNYERDDLMEAVAEINALRSRLTPSKDVKGLLKKLRGCFVFAVENELSDAFAVLQARLSPAEDVSKLLDDYDERMTELVTSIVQTHRIEPEPLAKIRAARQALSDALASRDADIHDLRLLHSGALAGIASRDAEIAEFQKERIKSSEAYARMLNELRSMSDELASLKAQVLTEEEAEQAMRAPFSSTIEHGPAWRSMQDKCRSIRSTLTTQEEKE